MYNTAQQRLWEAANPTAPCTNSMATQWRSMTVAQIAGIPVERVMTDNALEYVRSGHFADALTATGVRRHVRIRPWRPQTNGKVERFNQRLKREWAYQRNYTSTAARTARLDCWLHQYNHHRFHHAVDGSPITRVNNVPACDS